MRGPFSLMRIAALLDVHRNTVAKWIDEGCPVEQRADRDRGIEWELSLSEVVEWRISRAVRNAVATYEGEAGQITREEADRRRAIANAITAEISADEALGAVVARADAEADIATFCQVLKTGLSNTASKIAARAATMSSAPEIETMIHSELNRGYAAADAELAQRWPGTGEPWNDGGRAAEPAPEG